MNDVNDLRREHRGVQQVEVQENHRGRDMGQNVGRNDVVDNDPNDNDANDVNEHLRGANRNDGANHDRGDDRGVHGPRHR